MSNKTKTLQVGDIAPEFELKGSDGNSFRLSDCKGESNVVIAFYPAAFSSVCSKEMPLIQQAKTRFEATRTIVVGVSVDNTAALAVFATQMKIDYPLLSDFYPHGAVSESYGLLLGSGVSERAVIGIDTEGIVCYIDVVPILELPDLEPCLTTFRL